VKNRFTDSFFSSVYPLIILTPLRNFFLKKKSTDTLAISINDPWAGNSDEGYKILKGYLTVCGETISIEKNIWKNKTASKIWFEELHSFNWVKDLKAVGSNQARRFVRQCILDWMSLFSDWSKSIWKSDILAKRICNLLGSYNFFFSSADEMFQKTLIKSIDRQTTHLIRYKLNDIDGFNRIFGIKGMILGSVSFRGLNKNLGYCLALLLKEIDKQILSDGSHYLKSPSKHLEFLRNLIDIKYFLSRSKKTMPIELNNAIEKMASVLKSYLHGDGSLATFNDSQPIDKIVIDQIILRANSKLKIPDSSRTTGIYKIKENKMTFLIDTGNPIKENTFAGSLSFELSFGRNRIVVNSGAPHIQNKRWSEAMRSTAAHSTLTIDNVNSSDIFFGKQKMTRVAKVWSKKMSDGKSYLIESAHDGYKEIFGLVHNRKIHINCHDRVIRGHDLISKVTKNFRIIPKKFYIRFHIHPDVEANVTSSKKKVILKLKDGNGWEFICSDPIITLGESIYHGKESKIIRNTHILLKDKVLPDKKVKWLFRHLK
tara:strand:+ start:753 stop:2378 length:1626 start_codon:yes stop_codon:yes gene_type:complete